MNQTSNESEKTVVIKTLAIIGFIVALIFIAWLAVQSVRLVPVAFKTLASIINSIDKEDTIDFNVATNANIINTGELLTVSWTKPNNNGSYVFSYQCIDGVSAQIQQDGGEVSPLACDSEITLSQDTNSIGILFSSEKSRFVDISYTIEFTNSEAEQSDQRSGLVTVVNPSISIRGVAANNNEISDEDSNSESPSSDTHEEPATTNAGSSTTTHATPVATAPTTQYRTVPVSVTSYPISNPNGYSDLAVTFIGVGTYNADTKKFTPKSTLSENNRAAMQFEVKNIGTKTSSDWSFSASLPVTPTFTYSSAAQKGLKPNERQIITLQFDTGNDDSNERLTVAVTGTGDTTPTNNSFSKQISISN